MTGTPGSDRLVSRTVAGAFLGAFSIAACAVGGVVFTLLVAILLTIMLFEWCRMIEGEAFGPAFKATAIAGLVSLLAAGLGQYAIALGISMGGALLGGAVLKNRGTKWAWAALTGPYLLAPTVALIWLRNGLDDGRNVIFLLFAIVWSADTAAYFMGRLIGGPKLSPALSPAKTWAGAFGGVVAGGAAGYVAVDQFSAFLPASAPHSAISMTVAGAILGLVSIFGDMAESACKRFFNVKDISGVIPGHGGVLDRLDGMIFVTIVAALFIYGQSLATPV